MGFGKKVAALHQELMDRFSSNLVRCMDHNGSIRYLLLMNRCNLSGYTSVPFGQTCEEKKGMKLNAIVKQACYKLNNSKRKPARAPDPTRLWFQLVPPSA